MTAVRSVLAALTAVGVLVLSSCGDDGPSRSAVVADMTDTVVPERYEGLTSESASLMALVEAWCGGDARASEVVDQVVVARTQWVGLAPFWFGPVAEQRSRFIIDWEVDHEEIDELAASDQPVDAESLRELAGADQRGLGAVEYLAAGELDDRRCDYARGSAALVDEETSMLAAEWSTQGPTYASDEDAANDTLGNMVSETLFALAMVPDTADADVARAQLDGARWALIGDGGAHVGISPLLNDDVVDQLATEFDAAAANLDEASVMALERTIKTNVVSALGLTVNFSDADGDG